MNVVERTERSALTDKECDRSLGRWKRTVSSLKRAALTNSEVTVRERDKRVNEPYYPSDLRALTEPYLSESMASYFRL